MDSVNPNVLYSLGIDRLHRLRVALHLVVYLLTAKPPTTLEDEAFEKKKFGAGPIVILIESELIEKV